MADGFFLKTIRSGSGAIGRYFVDVGQLEVGRLHKKQQNQQKHKQQNAKNNKQTETERQTEENKNKKSTRITGIFSVWR